MSASVRAQLRVIWAPFRLPKAEIPASEQGPVNGLHNKMSQCTWQFRPELCKALIQKEILVTDFLSFRLLLVEQRLIN